MPFVVDRRELVKQACQKLDNIGVEYGIIANGFESDHEKYLQVASVYTLFSRINSNKNVFKPDDQNTIFINFSKYTF